MEFKKALFILNSPFMHILLLALLAGLILRSLTNCLEVLGITGRFWRFLICIFLTLNPAFISLMIYPPNDTPILSQGILPYLAELFLLATLMIISSVWQQSDWKRNQLGANFFFAFGLIVFGSITIIKQNFTPDTLHLFFFKSIPLYQRDVGIFRKLLSLMVPLEMWLVHISLLFLMFSGKKSWKLNVIICLILSLPFLLAINIAYLDIRSINRYRFSFLILIKLAGIAALWNLSRESWPGRLLSWIDPPKIDRKKKKILFLVPDDETFLIQRLVMAQGVQKAGYDVQVASEDTGFSHKILNLGFTFHRMDLNRGGLNPFVDFKNFVHLVFFLAKQQPDILQCVSIKPVIYGATAGSIVGLKRIVCLVNGLGYAFEGKNLKGKIIGKFAKNLYRNALALNGLRVIFQNPDDQSFFIEKKLVNANKTHLIRGSGVDMKKFIPTPQPQNSKVVVLYVGRLLWSKGIGELIKAVQNLKNENINFVLKVVGAPDEKNPESVPLSYIEKLNIEGIVEWKGRQSDMPKFYKEADIIVLPQQNREGLPLTLLEASSTGRAIISTDVPGCREVIRDQLNGIMIPPKDCVALTNALRTLILNPKLRKQYGEAGSKIVEHEFSAEIIQKQLSSVYEDLLVSAEQHIYFPVSSAQKG